VILRGNAKKLIHRAGARSAGIAAAATGAACAAGCRRFFSAYGKAGKLLAQPLALALWACGLLASQDNGFKLVVALLANVFKNRHIRAARVKLSYTLL
jgi:hypothetical protein